MDDRELVRFSDQAFMIEDLEKRNSHLATSVRSGTVGRAATRETMNNGPRLLSRVLPTATTLRRTLFTRDVNQLVAPTNEHRFLRRRYDVSSRPLGTSQK
ncbi:hypothetical protein CEXT_559531 [Caerostris extrusa]|uniref:Uncharacterized protein n=1 Tax=Caerostris extrusa TaxID=172846 RepID=A0AAV4SMW5_CAEEX|nr:hypothetical protein CEXT_559531 [Caerostris extrusa]